MTTEELTHESEEGVDQVWRLANEAVRPLGSRLPGREGAAVSDNVKRAEETLEALVALAGGDEGLEPELAAEVDALRQVLTGPSGDVMQLKANPGEPNIWWLMQGKRWIARVQMNGELRVAQQEAMLNALVSRGVQQGGEVRS